MMFHGVGDAFEDIPLGGTNVGGDASVSTSTYTPPVDTSGGSGDTYNIYQTTPSANPSGNPSSGFNWGGLFSTALNDATRVAQTFFTGQNQQAMTQAQLQAQANQLKYGTTVSASVGSSNLMPILLLGGGALVLVMVMKGRK